MVDIDDSRGLLKIELANVLRSYGTEILVTVLMKPREKSTGSRLAASGQAFGSPVGKTSDFNGKPLVVVVQDDLWLRRLRPKRFASLVNGKHSLNRLDPYGVSRMGHLSPVPAFAPFARVSVDDLAK